jgi:hypothetical protein
MVALYRAGEAHCHAADLRVVPHQVMPVIVWRARSKGYGPEFAGS